ncbi:MAG TPA: nicotinate phosphoribosyltransferase [Fimbriimonadaceae bacterium]|nr:nicotinate phosphoribosyltransferase [Fimbriimonadaceae bacterium]
MDQPPRLRLSPLAIADAYKESHSDQYPEGTTWVYSNLTPRRSRWPGMNTFVFFGLQAFLYDLNETFTRDFFEVPEEEAIGDFATFYREYFGSDNPRLCERIRRLHALGYLPLKLKALKEGAIVDHGVPVLTIENTHPDFFWLTNFVETWMSADLWHPSTSATTAHYYRMNFDKYAAETSEQEWFADFQGHDFSMRGMPGVAAAMASGAGHLLSFKGSDTCPAIHWIRRNYGGVDEGELLATSVPATEHSVMCAGSEEGEEETFLRLLTKVYPGGIVSVVSDTWDFWKVVTEILPKLKPVIMARDGKLVIRPDSSPKTPVEILIGDPDAPVGSPERIGLIECLWNTFGGTENAKGYRELDPHIGAIYGDSITLAYQAAILAGLQAKGFSSTNVVLGVGSYTYQYVTRDTHGIAIKATAVGRGWGEDFEIIPIFKDPKTDNSGKKSARGLLQVVQSGGRYVLRDGVTREECDGGCLEPVYVDGKFVRRQTFSEVRRCLAEHARARGS